ncbi:LOW QUALITY PROTEIN: calglandulin-like [Lycodopsis pacificus]
MGAVTLQSALGNPTLQQRGVEKSYLFLFSVLYSQLSGARVPPYLVVTEYKGVFEIFDKENGDVKTQELERLMRLMGINPTKDLSQMTKDVDNNGKGMFNCDSFLGLMGLYHERTKNQDAELRAAFKVFDKQGINIYPTLNKYVLMNAAEPLNETEAEQMMKEADKDGGGTINYEEFVAMMTVASFKMS